MHNLYSIYQTQTSKADNELVMRTELKSSEVQYKKWEEQQGLRKQVNRKLHPIYTLNKLLTTFIHRDGGQMTAIDATE